MAAGRAVGAAVVLLRVPGRARSRGEPQGRLPVAREESASAHQPARPRRARASRRTSSACYVQVDHRFSQAIVLEALTVARDRDQPHRAAGVHVPVSDLPNPTRTRRPWHGVGRARPAAPAPLAPRVRNPRDRARHGWPTTGWTAPSPRRPAWAPSAGDRPTSDRDLLLALQAALPADALDHLDRVIVFKASDAAGTVPPAVPARPVGDPSDVTNVGCNSYSGATVRSVSAQSDERLRRQPGHEGRRLAADDAAGRPGGPARLPRACGCERLHDGVTKMPFADSTLISRAVFRIQPDLAG